MRQRPRRSRRRSLRSYIRRRRRSPRAGCLPRRSCAGPTVPRMRVLPSAWRKSRWRKIYPIVDDADDNPFAGAAGPVVRHARAQCVGTRGRDADIEAKPVCGRAASIDTTLGSAATAATLLAGMSTVAMLPITERTMAPCARTASRLPSKRRMVWIRGSACPGSMRSILGEDCLDALLCDTGQRRVELSRHRRRPLRLPAGSPRLQARPPVPQIDAQRSSLFMLPSCYCLRREPNSKTAGPGARRVSCGTFKCGKQNRAQLRSTYRMRHCSRELRAKAARFACSRGQ